MKQGYHLKARKIIVYDFSPGHRARLRTEEHHEWFLVGVEKNQTRTRKTTNTLSTAQFFICTTDKTKIEGRWTTSISSDLNAAYIDGSAHQAGSTTDI
jgi:hypothetical protein